MPKNIPYLHLSSEIETSSTDILEFLPPPLWVDDLKQGGKNSRITPPEAENFEDFCSKILQKCIVFSCKNTKIHPKSAKISASGGRKAKNTFLLVRNTPNIVKYHIIVPRRRRNFFEFLPPVEFLPPPLVGGRFATRGGGKNSRISVEWEDMSYELTDIAAKRQNIA